MTTLTVRSRVPAFVPLLAALVLAACTENEEEVTVRADGSASVRLVARGDAADLADGYLLPLAAPWQPDDAGARRWLALAGPDTGGAGVRAAVEALPDASPLFESAEKRQTELAVRAEFASLDALPRTYAPETDPYQDAFLQRTTTLRVRDDGGRRVFVFERHYAPRAWARYDFTSRLVLAAGLEERLKDGREITGPERVDIAAASAAAFEQTTGAFAEDALSAIYLRGGAELDAGARERVLSTCRAAVASRAGAQQVRALFDAILPPETGVMTDDAGERMAAFERGQRDALREALDAALAAEGLAQPARNVALVELERLFTAYDHSADLNDDKLILTVHLPGRVVFASPAEHVESAEGGTARFHLDGDDLHDREVVLRAVSVLE